MDIAVVGAGATLTLEPGDGLCDKARIALGSVAPIPLRTRRIEEFLIGRRLDGDVLREVGEIAAEEGRPIDDVRGSAWFRTEIVKVLVRRMVKCAWSRATQE
jgi:carbon-monoxide dehydrogenase medium subunit